MSESIIEHAHPAGVDGVDKAAMWKFKDNHMGSAWIYKQGEEPERGLLVPDTIALSLVDALNRRPASAPTVHPARDAVSHDGLSHSRNGNHND
jgi:hypothetical protein